MKRMKYRASKVAFLGLLLRAVGRAEPRGIVARPDGAGPRRQAGTQQHRDDVLPFLPRLAGGVLAGGAQKPVRAADARAGRRGDELRRGLVSVTAMLLLRALPKKPSELFTSICGGLMHNAGQLVMAVLLLNGAVLYYFPVLALGASRWARSRGCSCGCSAAFQPNLLLTPRPEAGRRMMILQLPP